MRKAWMILTAAVAVSANVRAAPCTIDAGAKAALVELYTSEGCSSCPPADRWLAGLSDPAVFPLAFHVDYWDQLGWPDRFAQAAFTTRQRTVAERNRQRAIYTPEVVLNGREFRAWSSDSIRPLPMAATLRVTLSLDGNTLRVLPMATASSDDTLLVALSETNLSTQVPRGENAGRRLQHAHVVRALQSQPGNSLDEITLRVPDDLNTAQSSATIWIEAPDGAVRSALRTPLSVCSAP